MKPNIHYRRWILGGCGAACAVLVALPGSARASRFDEDLAPLRDRPLVASAERVRAPAPAPTPAPAQVAPEKRAGRTGHTTAAPSWLKHH